MATLYAQCPSCETAFRISDTQLKAADGLVRCGACLRIFNAFAHEIARPAALGQTQERPQERAPGSDDGDQRVHLPPEKQTSDNADPDPEHEAPFSRQEPNLDESDLNEPDFDESDFNQADLDEANAEDSDFDESDTDESEFDESDLHESDLDESEFDESDLDESDLDEFDFDDDELDDVLADESEPADAPIRSGRLHHLAHLDADHGLDPLTGVEALPAAPVELEHETRPWQRLRSLGLALVNLLLLAALLGQLIWHFQDSLREHPRYARLMQTFCNWLPCHQPPSVDIAAIRAGELLVRSHPSAEQALQVDFIFSNQASFPQPFPTVELSFNALNGAPIANRLFMPSEYLPENLQQFKLMPPGRPVQVHLEILDPGPEAVNYSLRFRRAN